MPGLSALSAERAAAGFLGIGFAVTVFARALDPNAFNPDVAWILYVSEQMLSGVALYRDLVEDKPPMVFWLGAMSVAVAQLAGTTAILVFNSIVLLLTGLASALVYRISRLGWPESTSSYRLALVASFAAAAVLYPGLDYGQRENLVFILLAPYIFAAASTARGSPSSDWTAHAVGVLAGVALAIEPYYALVWLGVELWLRLQQLARPAWSRPENRALVGVLLLYLAACLIFAPGYWDGLELAAAVYSTDGLLGNSWLLAQSAAGAVVLAGALRWFFRDTPVDRELRSVWLVSAIAFLAVALLEGRGWLVDYYPASAAAFVLIAILLLGLVESPEALADVLRPRAAALPLLALLLLGGYGALSMGLAGVAVWGPAGPQPSTLTELVRVVEAKGWRRPLYVMSSSTTPSFPLVNLTSARWSSRFCCLGLLPGFYSDRERATRPFPYRSREEMSELERQLIDSVVSDLQAAPPTLLIVDHTGDEFAFPSSEFGYLDYFRRDPRFAAFLRQYRPLTAVGSFRIYSRGAPGG